MSTDITRDDWAIESERLCPSSQAFSAYEQIERMVAEETELVCIYKKVPRGQSSYCTFTGAAAGKVPLIQVYKGICQLNWRWKPKITGLNEEQHAEVNSFMEAMRVELNGKEGKGWETIKVLRLGIDNVEESIKKAADGIDNVFAVAAKEE